MYHNETPGYFRTAVGIPSTPQNGHHALVLKNTTEYFIVISPKKAALKNNGKVGLKDVKWILFIQTDLEKNQVQKKSYVFFVNFTEEVESTRSTDRPPKWQPYL